MRNPITKADRQFSVMGLPLHLLDDYSGWLFDQLHQQLGCHVVTLNAEMTMQAEQNSALAEIIHHAELVIPDGAGIVFYLRLYGKRVARCPGIELAESILKKVALFNLEQRDISPSENSLHPHRVSTIESSPTPAVSVFFFGGAPEVAQTAADRWQKRLPGLAIVGVQNGYLSAEEEPAFLEMLQMQQPQIMFVGLGVPRQELWIAQHRHLCPKALWIGVGGSFDIWAGTKTRAPGWLRDNHLEWVYRLYQEPWRWRRMMALPQFAGRSILYRLTKRNPISTRF